MRTRIVLSFLILLFVSAGLVSAQQSGIKVKVLSSEGNSTKIEYQFLGYEQSEVKINGATYLNLSAPDMIVLMEKGYPQLPTYRGSIIIPDLAGMNYRILSSEYYEVQTGPIMPSKGHFTRDIDPETVPYTFSNFYNTDTYYPTQNILLDVPYIVRDLRGMTVQFNPMQYNHIKSTLKICKKMVIEVYADPGTGVINPFKRTRGLTAVDYEFASIYRSLFLNYGVGSTRFDSIPEPGRMLIIYASQYATTIVPLVQWKQSRGLTVLTAEYPTQTGTGNTAVKTYIQNLYNQTEKITYIILVGESDQIPTLNGVYESAPSDPCYVKLAGTDAYPDAFISRISCPNPANAAYVIEKLIRMERDVTPGAPWYNKATGVAGPDNGGTPSYTDSIRMNWVRDTLLLGGFTHVDKVNGPIATAQTLINVLNDGRFVLNYIGHGSGTSWSNTGFNVSNAYQLANGWMNPFLVDVACLNGNFTLSECLAEALLRAGDTANPKGCSSIYASSTNASWVPPCDMQMYAMRLMAHQWRKTAGAMSFFGVMKAMDMWGGSSGEGLKLMEQYNIFGDCSLLLTRGVPLGPAISHAKLPNTENLNGPYVVNCVITPATAPLVLGETKLLWSRNNTVITDSIVMTNSSGNNWTANIPGNGTAAIYRYYIKTLDTAGRTGKLPGTAPTELFSFYAATDTTSPVLTHTPLQNTPKTLWPATVTASATDNIGIDSVWVNWYINNTSTGIRTFRLNNTTGNNYSALFNSVPPDVNFNDSIFYRIVAQDAGSLHKKDSTQLYSFKIINQVTVNIGNGTTAVGWPFYTFYMDSRTQMLYLASEITAQGGAAGFIPRIGFNVATVASQTMNGFYIKMQNTTSSTVSTWINTGWTVCYNGAYTVPGTGWQYVDLNLPFYWDGTSNLLIEICFNNSSYTSNTTVYATASSGRNIHYHSDLSTGDGCAIATTPGSTYTALPNISIVMNPGPNNITGDPRELPTTYSLSQNYPNPFNPVTKINFAIPKQSFVTIKVFDILGREVKTLINENKSAGNYIVEFNASTLASGVYYYRIEAGDFRDVKKMILIK